MCGFGCNVSIPGSKEKRIKKLFKEIIITSKPTIDRCNVSVQHNI